MRTAAAIMGEKNKQMTQKEVRTHAARVKRPLTDSRYNYPDTSLVGAPVLPCFEPRRKYPAFP